MDNEPFLKQGFNWKKHFMSVTPLSKYLAMALFIFLPFAGFVLGMKYEDERVVKYEPIILERVFEKEIVVEKAGTSTPEVKIIIFSGNVRDGGQNKCMVDGICSTLVSEYEVIWAQGWQSEAVGTKDAVRAGDRVEVFGKMLGEKKVTLYGNENYYIKKITDKTKDTTPKERGNLLILRNEGGLCIYGGCWSELIVFTDGTWEYEDGQGIFDEGNLTSADISNIISNVASTDFALAKTHEFTDTCPIAYDGQKSVYTFYTELGVIKVDSCETDTTKTALFKTITNGVLDSIYKEIAR